MADLGADELRRYHRDPHTGLLTEDGIATTFAPGSGPRHLTFSATGTRAYVTCELDVTVVVLAWDVASGTGVVIQQIPATDRRKAPGVIEYPSHIELQGRDRVLVTTRGSNVLTTLRVDPEGLLTGAEQIALPGGWPRHFAVVDDLVVVADQTEDAVIALRDGVVTSQVAIPAAACILAEWAPAHRLGSE